MTDITHLSPAAHQSRLQNASGQLDNNQWKLFFEQFTAIQGDKAQDDDEQKMGKQNAERLAQKTESHHMHSFNTRENFQNIPQEVFSGSKSTFQVERTQVERSFVHVAKNVASHTSQSQKILQQSALAHGHLSYIEPTAFEGVSFAHIQATPFRQPELSYGLSSPNLKFGVANLNASVSQTNSTVTFLSPNQKSNTATVNHTNKMNSSRNPLVNNHETTWQAQHLAIKNKNDKTTIFYRDYRLSENQRNKLYHDLLEQFGESHSTVDVVVNGKRFKRN